MCSWLRHSRIPPLGFQQEGVIQGIGMADPEFPRPGKRVPLAECMRRWRMDSGNAAENQLADDWRQYLLHSAEKDKYPV